MLAGLIMSPLLDIHRNLKMHRLVLLAISLMLFGCSGLPINTTDVEVVVPTDVQFSYIGKGPGAGIALMSSMGPVGIAVGVAIDEGVRKRLLASALAEGFDIRSLVRKAYGADLDSGTGRSIQITILGYGMRLVPGSEDRVIPYLKLERVSEDGAVTQVEFPNDFELDDTLLSELYQVEDYIADGAKILLVFGKALDRVSWSTSPKTQ